MFTQLRNAICTAWLVHTCGDDFDREHMAALVAGMVQADHDVVVRWIHDESWL